MDQDTKYPRILAIAPSTTGFGFAVLEAQGTLVNWGAKQVRGDKNKESLARVDKIIAEYMPQVMVLEDTSAGDSRRYTRIRRLTKMLKTLAKKRRIKVALFSRKQVMRAFLPDGKGTKHKLTEIIALRFPDELAAHLPPKRKFYKKEDYRMEIFIALALAIMLPRTG